MMADTTATAAIIISAGVAIVGALVAFAKRFSFWSSQCDKNSLTVELRKEVIRLDRRLSNVEVGTMAQKIDLEVFESEM